MYFLWRLLYLNTDTETEWNSVICNRTDKNKDHYNHHHVVHGVGSLVDPFRSHVSRTSEVYHDSFYKLGNNVSLPWVIYFEAFGFFLWDLPVVKISTEWVTVPDQGMSNSRITTFNLWTGMLRDGISIIPGETVIPLWLGRHILVCENRVYHEKVRMTVGQGTLWYHASLHLIMKHYSATVRRNHVRPF